ncbi:MAG: hypothetical protein PHQ65_10385 [Bacteroidales bacterium]|jgi:hypothetical protein|nr:hypothetical protein [Bacteroidales bacterium]MDD3665659.1 hypothetical protein [Bacteroidales bacterium]
MKKNALLSLLFLGLASLLVSTTSCDKVKEAASFDVKINAPAHQFTLDSADYLTKSTLEESLFTYQLVNINIDSVLNAAGISSATISNGGVTNTTLTILLPPGSNFDWLQSARVTAAATLEGLPTGTQIAHTGTINPGSSTLDLILDNAALTTFINNSNFYVGVFGTLVGPLPSSQVTCVFNSTFVFTVNPLGE